MRSTTCRWSWIPKFAEFNQPVSGDSASGAGGGCSRGAADWARWPATIQSMRQPVKLTLLFLETDDSTLLRRFSETRRPHPLGKSQSVAHSIGHERELLEPIRALADIDHSTPRNSTVHELREANSPAVSGGRPGSAHHGICDELRVPERPSAG